MVDGYPCVGSNRLVLFMQQSHEGCVGLKFNFLVARERAQRVLMLLFRPAVLASRIKDSRTVFFLNGVVDAIHSSPVRKNLCCSLVQDAEVRPKMRGCLKILRSHLYCGRGFGVAKGERGSRRIVARIFRVTQETPCDSTRRVPGVCCRSARLSICFFSSAVVRACPPAALMFFVPNFVVSIALSSPIHRIHPISRTCT